MTLISKSAVVVVTKCRQDQSLGQLEGSGATGREWGGEQQLAF